MKNTYCDILIVGAGIVGTSLAFVLSHIAKKKKIIVIDQAPSAAFHTSSRNTGKVHAPFLYDPKKKKLFARFAYLGFNMWKEYSQWKNLPFKNDGVLEVSHDYNGTKTLEKYVKWGIQNGLEEEEIKLLDRNEVKEIESEVECSSAIFCSRDASVDYGKFAKSLMQESVKKGIHFLLQTRLIDLKVCTDSITALTSNNSNENRINTKLLINVAGGESVDIAHKTGVAKELTDIHFRGEYWKADKKISGLTRTSVYSVPKFPEYPFLDPHWIVRVDGSSEVGPNAVPVFGPYAYDNVSNMRMLFPKLFEILGSGSIKLMFNGRFQTMAVGEFLTSLSRTAMIRRVKRFLPKIEPSNFKERGIAGIRSSVVDSQGRFVPDAIIKEGPFSIHVLNYNSPGASGALPFAVYLIEKLRQTGNLEGVDPNAVCGIWNYNDLVDSVYQENT